MHSLPNLLFCIVLCASFLRLAAAAPAAACVVSYYVTTILVPATTDSALDPSLSTTAGNIVATTSDPPATTSTNTPTSISTVPTLPINGGVTELPSPTAALKFVTVGRGVQNYSCSAAGAVPVQVGALATLYDFTSLAETSESTLNTVPPNIVYTPISSDSGSTLTVDSVGTFPIIGHHYFAADGTPTFDLSYVGDLLSCTKIATVNAPSNANVGPNGTGAVPWLMLTDKGGSVGLSQVYRVVTAGGKAPATCPDANLISIQYAAEYWFFG